MSKKVSVVSGSATTNKGHLNKLFYIMLLIDLCSILKMIYKTENKAILFFLCLRKRIDF